jgi:arginine decarboxylase
LPSSHETNRYWLFPGPVRLASYRRQLDDMETERLAEQVNLAARLLAEYGDRTALFDEVTPLAKQELVARATQQQFYTVLLADDSPQRTREPGRRTARLATSG